MWPSAEVLRIMSLILRGRLGILRDKLLGEEARERRLDHAGHALLPRRVDAFNEHVLIRLVGVGAAVGRDHGAELVRAMRGEMNADHAAEREPDPVALVDLERTPETEHVARRAPRSCKARAAHRSGHGRACRSAGCGSGPSSAATCSSHISSEVHERVAEGEPRRALRAVDPEFMSKPLTASFMRRCPVVARRRALPRLR